MHRPTTEDRNNTNKDQGSTEKTRPRRSHLLVTLQKMLFPVQQKASWRKSIFTSSPIKKDKSARQNGKGYEGRQADERRGLKSSQHPPLPPTPQSRPRGCDNSRRMYKHNKLCAWVPTDRRTRSRDIVLPLGYSVHMLAFLGGERPHNKACTYLSMCKGDDGTRRWP